MSYKKVNKTKPIKARETQFTEQKEKRENDLKVRDKAKKMHNRPHLTIQIEPGLWIQTHDLISPENEIKNKWLENHKRGDEILKSYGGKNG